MKNTQPRAGAKSAAATSDASPALALATSPSQDAARRGRPTAPRSPRTAGWAYFVAAAIAALWILALIVATAPLHDSGFAVVLITLLALGPTALLVGLAYLVSQGDKLAGASTGPDDQGAALLGPALRAAAEAGHAASEIRTGLAATAAEADKARTDLETLREALSKERGSNDVVTEFLGAGRSSLMRRMKTEVRDLEARSKALDDQLAQAAEIIELHVKRTAAAAEASAAQFGEAAKTLEASTARLLPAAEQVAAAVRAAGLQTQSHSEKLGAAAGDLAGKADALGRAAPDRSESLRALQGSLRAAQKDLLEAARAQVAALQSLLSRIGAATRELGVRAVDAADALRSGPKRAAPPTEPTPAVSIAIPANDSARVDVAAPKVELPARTEPPVERVRMRPATPASDRATAAPAAVLTARGIGGQVVFDGSRLLIDRTQSASFVMHGAGGQRSIPLSEVVKIRFEPPRRGAHGYLQFVLSRGHEGRGGPADVNSILFDASQQPSFQEMAEVLQRALRHLRRHPAATDPRAPGELAYLMDLRGRGLIDAQEFADATARLPQAKRGLFGLLRRRSKT